MNADRRNALLAAALLAAAAVPSAARPSMPPAEPKLAPRTTAEDLPGATEILQQYVEALGGESTIRGHTSIAMEGEMRIPSQGMTGQLKIQAAAPDSFLLELNMPGLGEIRQGYDGEVGWMLHPVTGPMLLTGDMLQEVRREADFYRNLNYDRHYETIEVVEKTEFNDRPAYKLRLVTPDERESSEYFDTETHLKIGESAKAPTPMGEVLTTVFLEDYKRFDDVKHPTLQTVKQMGIDQIIATEKVQYDGVDPSVFALPDAIKTLLEQQADEDEEPAPQPE